MGNRCSPFCGVPAHSRGVKTDFNGPYAVLRRIQNTMDFSINVRGMKEWGAMPNWNKTWQTVSSEASSSTEEEEQGSWATWFWGRHADPQAPPLHTSQGLWACEASALSWAISKIRGNRTHVEAFGGFNECLLVKLLECSVVLCSHSMLPIAAAVDWKGYS